MFKPRTLLLVLIFLILVGSIVPLSYAQDTDESYDGDEYTNGNDASIQDEEEVEEEEDTDGDVTEEGEVEEEEDTDGDGIPDVEDNCPNTPNPDQSDTNDNGEGNQCDTANNNYDNIDDDTDGDGIPDAEDDCPDQANSDQKDSDGDGVGNSCYQLDVGSIASFEAFNDMVEEATSREGAVVTYSYGEDCFPESGSTFVIGITTVECDTSSDSIPSSESGGKSVDQFTFKVTVTRYNPTSYIKCTCRHNS